MYVKPKDEISIKHSLLIRDLIKEYIKRNKQNFYGKTENETVIYRAVRLRKLSVDKLDEYSKKTGISFTRLVNGALKEFLENQ